MTTRILSFRALRLALASFIVGALAFAFPFAFVTWLGVVGLALAWLVVPGDRRWFVPASLVLATAAFFWPMFATVRYPLGDGSEILVGRLTGRVDMLPPNRFRTTTDWYRLHPEGWVRLTPSPSSRPSLLAYLGFTRSTPRKSVAADTFAVGIPPVPPDLAVKGGCLSLSGRTWVPCPDVEYLPIWHGQRVVSKDTIAVDRLPDGRCSWGSSTLKAPPNNLAAMIGERHPKTCRAVVYDIDMVTPPWTPPPSSQ